MTELCTNAEFERVYADFKDKVTQYVYGRIPSVQDADDIVSDGFVNVFNGLSGFDREKASLSTWVYMIAHNTVIDYYRTTKPVYELPDDLCCDNNIDERLLNNEMLESLANALEQLSGRERDIIILHYYSGKTLKSIAEKMDISYSYVKVLHGNALKALHKLMSKEYL